MNGIKKSKTAVGWNRLQGRVLRVALAAAVSLVAAASLYAGGQKAGGSQPITVISREDGSGTRSAFVELFEVVDGDKKDNTTVAAEVTNNTAVMMTSVAGDRNAIGYLSLGSLNSSVKALKIDGAEANAANIRSGAYTIARPFYIAVRNDVSEAAKRFIAFMTSPEGQAIVSANGYLPLDAAAPPASPSIGTSPRPPAGTRIVVAGSSSVTPLMEKLREAYIAKYAGIEIEIQQSDSSTGVNSAINGICDIGMASRTLRQSEIDKGLQGIVIATDGIVVIVNKTNPHDGLSREEVKAIYSGSVTDWNALTGTK
jgi:phosphate transport system substrate-binding protein